MKECPTCKRTFDDAMRFCQTDGTPLVDAPPPVDPYKTMVARPEDIAAAIPPDERKPAEPEPAAENDVLEIPPVETDPKKTMYASEAEIRNAMAEADQVLEPEPPKFIEPEVKPEWHKVAVQEDFELEASKTTPPIPSPFSEPQKSEHEPPQFEQAGSPFTPSEPEPAPPSFTHPEPPPSPTFNPFDSPAQETSAPIAQAEWTPPPVAQEQSWQDEQPMQNPQYQPGSGLAASPNQTLAIVSLILGIAGLIFCAGLTGPPAVITGMMARKKAKNNPREYGGEGLALGGIITGILATLVLLLVVAYFIFVFLFVGLSMAR